jgi:predicted nuclease of predicted toxin-antitoxin system
MRFLIDAQLPPALCRWLEARGHEADHVASIGLIASTDAEIAAHIESTGGILISKDEDFLVLRLPDRFALLWLRCGNATNAALAQWLDQRWERVEQLLADGERLIELR